MEGGGVGDEAMVGGQYGFIAAGQAHAAFTTLTIVTATSSFDFTQDEGEVEG